MEILNCYIIASIQRSGTHLLCTLLRSTGVAGLPAEHFFGKKWRDLGASLELAITDGIHQACVTAQYNGKWCLWHGSHVELFRSDASDVAGHSNIQRSGRGESSRVRFPRTEIRLASSTQSGGAGSLLGNSLPDRCLGSEAGEKPRPRDVPRFDFKVIDEWCKRVAEHDAAWANYFRENRIEPLTVVYEDLVANNRATVEQLLEFLNVPLPVQIEIVSSGLEKQANQMSTRWIAAYLEQKNDSANKRDRIIRRLKQSIKQKEGPKRP